MKVHFFGSLAGNSMKHGQKTNYEHIIDMIEKLGYMVLTRHCLYRKVEDILKTEKQEHEQYFRKMTRWLSDADIIVVEATKPEIGTGYELALAVQTNKPIIVLYIDGQFSPVYTGQNSPKIQYYEYTVPDLYDTLKIALDEAKEQIDTRFTLLLPPTIISFLNQLSAQGKNRSEYIRDLIFEDMKRRGE